MSRGQHDAERVFPPDGARRAEPRHRAAWLRLGGWQPAEITGWLLGPGAARAVLLTVRGEPGCFAYTPATVRPRHPLDDLGVRWTVPESETGPLLPTPAGGTWYDARDQPTCPGCNAPVETAHRLPADDLGPAGIVLLPCGQRLEMVPDGARPP
ncbi:hypothetical protein [Actinomadura parmotrematis]|uniref:Uncharacterized protein n=1 Tax=Actinomadura parmotrematis TaxID=2864039 RepID=A0ABS7G420_9ACTN|nr:hypothetical protein [Actinomadura parmotrematis]MBW8486975.1 hypothetical protein [Actinomadura parmotrematis]